MNARTPPPDKGTKFGRWTVLDYILRGGRGNLKVRCSCADKTVRVVQMSSILRGASISCGCVQKEVASKRARKHGESGTPLYKVWNAMMQRCYNENHPRYKDWGGRGIVICRKWRRKNTGYTNFKEWALANGWKRSLQIDRRDNDRGYTPKNCRFVKPIVNVHNRRCSAKYADRYQPGL